MLWGIILFLWSLAELIINGPNQIFSIIIAFSQQGRSYFGVFIYTILKNIVDNIKNNIRKLRKIHNLTQEELAGKANVSRQTIIAIEKEKYDPSLKLALKIARILRKPVENIFYTG